MAKRLKIETIFKAIDRVSAPIRRMQSRVQRFARRVKRSLRSVDRVTSKIARGLAVGMKRGAILAAAAIGTVVVATTRLTAEVDKLAKLTRRLDFPIEQFQEWRFVAEQSGLTTDEFGVAVSKFAKTLGELRSGYGTMYENLRRIDPAFTRQMRQTNDTSEAFEMYIDRIRQTPNALDRAALATLAFGRSGAKLINIAGTSAEQIEKLREEMRQNGVVTAEQAKMAEAFNDALNSLKRAGLGFLQGVLLPMLPMVTKHIRAFREWAIANREIIATKIQDFIQKVIDNFGEITKWLKRIAIAIGVFFAFAGAVKVLIGVMEVLNVIMMANPIGLIVAGVAALAGMIAAAFIWGKKIKALFDELPTPIKAFVLFVTALSGPFAIFLAAVVMLRVHFEKVKRVALVVFKAIGRAARATFDFIEKVWAPIEDFFVSLWNNVVNIFQSAINFLITTGPISWLIGAVLAIKRNWTFIAIVFEALWETVKTIFGNAVQTIIDGPVAWIVEAVEPIATIWRALPILFQAIWSIITDTFTSAIDWIVNSGPVQWLIGGVEKTESAWRPIVDFFTKIWDTVVGVFETAINKITKIASPIIEAFKKISKAKDKLIGEEIGKIDLGALKIEREGEPLKNVIDVDFKKRARLPEVMAPVSAVKQQEKVGGKVVDLTNYLRGREDREQQENESMKQLFKPQTVGPEERIVRILNEQREERKAEVTIRDETGRAELTRGDLGGNVKIERTGSF
jgi:hypothetical protein